MTIADYLEARRREKLNEEIAHALDPRYPKDIFDYVEELEWYHRTGTKIP